MSSGYRRLGNSGASGRPLVRCWGGTRLSFTYSPSQWYIRHLGILWVGVVGRRDTGCARYVRHYWGVCRRRSFSAASTSYIPRHAHFVYLCRPDVQGFSGPDDVCVLKVSRTGCNLVGSLQSAYGLVEFDMRTSRVYSKWDLISVCTSMNKYAVVHTSTIQTSSFPHPQKMHV